MGLSAFGLPIGLNCFPSLSEFQYILRNSESQALFSYFPDYRPDCEDNAQRQPGEGADQLDRQIGFQHKCLLSGIEKPPCRKAWWFLCVVEIDAVIDTLCCSAIIRKVIGVVKAVHSNPFVQREKDVIYLVRSKKHSRAFQIILYELFSRSLSLSILLTSLLD